MKRKDGLGLNAKQSMEKQKKTLDWECDLPLKDLRIVYVRGVEVTRRGNY